MKSREMDKFEEIRTLARSYFPDIRFVEDPDVLETVDKGEVFSSKDEVLPYLQTIFFEEHLVEVQVDQITRVFFAYVADDLPDMVEEEVDNELVIVEPEYEAGSYLKKKESFLLTPLTPGIGNAQVRGAKRIVIRFFTGTIAIEMGCSFREGDVVRDIPVLRFNFPVIGRVNRSFRSFRVKAVPSIDAKVCISSVSQSKVSELYYPIVDVSAEGLAFTMDAGQPPLQPDVSVQFLIKVAGISDLQVAGNIRHITKARDKNGLKTIYGVQFDLETRALAADLERLAAAVQRLHLREIADKTANMEGVTLVR